MWPIYGEMRGRNKCPLIILISILRGSKLFSPLVASAVLLATDTRASGPKKKKMSEPPGPQQGQQNGSQIEAWRCYETKSFATNGSIRNRRMCRRTAVPPETSFFFVASKRPERQNGTTEKRTTEGRRRADRVALVALSPLPQAQGFAIWHLPLSGHRSPVRLAGS